MIQKIDSKREIGIEMIGARELWIGIDREGELIQKWLYRWVMGREMGIERESCIRKNGLRKNGLRERKRVYNKGLVEEIIKKLRKLII